jgi:hypothetical protein
MLRDRPAHPTRVVRRPSYPAAVAFTLALGAAACGSSTPTPARQPAAGVARGDAGAPEVLMLGGAALPFTCADCVAKDEQGTSVR